MVNSPSAHSLASERAGQFFWVIKSIREFDKTHVAGVLRTIIQPNPRDNCFFGVYYRAIGNVESLLKLDNASHFQAAAMIARSLFELAMDAYLIDKIPQAVAKLIFFSDLEKLRSARKLIEFQQLHPDRSIDVSSQTEFVTNNTVRIESNCGVLWPGIKLRDIKNWSTKTVEKRAEFLGYPFDEIYKSRYPMLSWYVHSGITGVGGYPSEAFANVHGMSLTLAVTCYSKILEAVIHEFKIDLVDEKILKTMKYATLLPFTNTPEQQAALFQELLHD